MQTTHFRNQLHLRRAKVGFLILAFLGISISGFSQGLFGLTSTSGSDDKLISYGFFLAGHTATYQIKYSEQFFDAANAANNQVYSIYPKYTPGFSLGFTGILRLHDQVNLLFTPKIAFYEYRADINYYPPPSDMIAGDEMPSLTYRTEEVVNEATMVELPLLFKYRSQRFNNTRMYFIGGASYQFRTKSQDEANVDPIVTTGSDVALEAGMGFEIYFKYFKFAPEIRFSHGLNNIYYAEKTPAEIRDVISSIKRKGITIYLNFQ
jgi:hypothetical protein